MGTLLLNDHTSWPVWFWFAFCGVIALGLEILSRIVPRSVQTDESGRWKKDEVTKLNRGEEIDIRFGHLDSFDNLDNVYITINKCLTMLFVYHVVVVSCSTPTIKWQSDELTLANSIGALVACYVFYDFFYMNFHRFLHQPWLYAYIHKHHHKQKAPTRGNLDAINVHPFEFLVGEYLHLLTIYVIPCHIYAVIFFILAGGILASLNHSRHNIKLLRGIYSVDAHDVHHHVPDSNYGQYTMLWDHLFQTFVCYEDSLSTKIARSTSTSGLINTKKE